MANALRVIKEKLFADITEVPPLLQASHLPSLDGFRGISILMVVISHMLVKVKFTQFNGIFGVNVFYVISGFIITTLLLKEKFKTRDLSLRKFYMRRILKIVPVAYLYLLVVFLLNCYFKFVSMQDILSAVLFIKNTNIIHSHWDEVTGHFWSLSVEEQFYIFFPFILKRSTNGFTVIVILLIIIIPILLAFEGHSIGIFKTNGMHIFLDFFRFITPILVGALFSVLIYKKVITKRLYPATLLTNLIVLYLAYRVYCGTGLASGLYYKNFISSLFVALLIVNNLFVSNDWFYKMLNCKPMVIIGMASYSIYLWQQIFTMGRPWSGLFPYADSAWLNFLVLVPVSFFSYYFIEKKMAALKKHFR